MITTITYTATDSFLVPSGVTSVTAHVWGKGFRGSDGGGGDGGDGGAGGAFSKGVVSVTPLDYLTVFMDDTQSYFISNTTVQAPAGTAGGPGLTGVGDLSFQGGHSGGGAVGQGGGGGSSGGAEAAGNDGSSTDNAGGAAPAGGFSGGYGGVAASDNGTEGGYGAGGGGGGISGIGGAGGGGLIILEYDDPELDPPDPVSGVDYVTFTGEAAKPVVQYDDVWKIGRAPTIDKRSRRPVDLLQIVQHAKDFNFRFETVDP